MFKNGNLVLYSICVGLFLENLIPNPPEMMKAIPAQIPAPAYSQMYFYAKLAKIVLSMKSEKNSFSLNFAQYFGKVAFKKRLTYWKVIETNI